MQANLVHAVTAPQSSVYQAPKLYDVAFSHRDVPAEIHVVTEWFMAVTGGRTPESVLELAAGPASHAVEFARRGLSATALDCSPEMTEYASQKARGSRVSLRVVNADMVDFSLRERFDLGLLLMDSASHILCAKDMIRHLQCVSNHLNPGGLYVIELFNQSSKRQKSRPSLENKWTASCDDGELDVEWGCPSDSFDPQTSISYKTVTMSGKVGNETVSITDKLKTHAWSQFAMEKAITASGAFVIARRHGDFLFGSCAQDNSAARLIYVLRKIG
jgi:hypothetical protein